jgi:eukaryotic-like serine/threonine-protein kinase
VPIERLGHYRLSEQIGAGGIGEVYRVYDEHLHRDVAIKILLVSTSDSAPAHSRLLDAARSASGVTRAVATGMAQIELA